MVEMALHATSVNQKTLNFRGQRMEAQGRGEGEGRFGKTREGGCSARGLDVSFCFLFSRAYGRLMDDLPVRRQDTLQL